MGKRIVKKILLLSADSNGSYPIPAVKGGAVSILVEHLIQDNERAGLFNFTVLSFYDQNAKEKTKNYKNTQFIWVKVPRILELGNKLVFYCVKHLFPKKKSLSYKSVFSLLFYIAIARKVLSKYNFDKIIIENNIPLSLSLHGRLRKYRGKYYYHLHNVPRINAANRNIILNASGFLCVSKYVGDEISKESNPIGPVPKDKIKILRNCIDLDVFNENSNLEKIKEIKRKFKISSKDNVILFAGRISKEKGIDQVIKSFKIAYKKDKSLKLLIIGSYMHGSNIKTEYQNYLDSLSSGVQTNIIYTGYIDQSDLKYYYQIAKISIFSSMWNEPAGLTLLESMACGTPVITTRSGGIPEYVKDKAIVLERNSKLPEYIASNLELLLNNTSLYKKYVDEGKMFVSKNYSSVGYVNKLRKIIDYE